MWSSVDAIEERHRLLEMKQLFPDKFDFSKKAQEDFVKQR
jgi:hypothetical protein